MNIVTLEFRQMIQDLIDDLEAEQCSDGAEYRLARQHNALPIGVDFDIYLFVSAEGELIWDNAEGEGGIATDTQSLIRGLVAGKIRYSQLARFIPNRRGDSKKCPVCEGKGVWEKSKDVSTGNPGKCVICAGLGWVTEEFCKEFTEHQIQQNK